MIILSLPPASYIPIALIVIIVSSLSLSSCNSSFWLILELCPSPLIEGCLPLLILAIIGGYETLVCIYTDWRINPSLPCVSWRYFTLIWDFATLQLNPCLVWEHFQYFWFLTISEQVMRRIYLLMTFFTVLFPNGIQI